MSWLWLGLAAAVVAAIGHAAVRATGLARRFDLALAVSAGVVVVASVGTFGVVLGTERSAAAIFGIGCAAALYLLRAGWSLQAERPRPGVERRLLLLTGGAWSLLLLFAAGDRLSWDGWAIWTFKARVLAYERTLPESFLTDGRYAFSHPDYPLALPVLQWWMGLHGPTLPIAASMTGALLVGALAALMWSAVRERCGERVATFAALGTILFWPVVFYAVGGTADVLMALAFLGAVTSLAAPGGRGRAAVFLALGALSKNEGLALAAVALVATAAVDLRHHRLTLRSIAPLFAPLLVALPWLAHTRSLGLGAGHLAGAGEGYSLAVRLPVLLGGVADVLTSPLWLPVTALGVAGMLAGLARREGTGDPAAWVALGYACVLAAVYARTPYDLVWLMETSLERVTGTLVPGLVYLSAVTLIPTAGVLPANPPQPRSAVSIP
jgi:hypothetical protein